MSNTDGLNYTPLFHSEISSSYLIHEIFNRHDEIAREFLKTFLGIELSTETLSIKREHNYKGEGSIDLFIRFNNRDRETHVLVEVKVHDYKSATKDQIQRYYNAAKEASIDADIYFIYLTQFNKKNQPKTDNISIPPTIEVFNRSKELLDEKKLTHVNWEEFHTFMHPFLKTLSGEEKLMLDLQKKWLIAKSKEDLRENINTVGKRTFSDYFDITNDIEKALPFGEKKPSGTRLNYVIQLRQRSKDQLDDIIQIIITFSNSGNVDNLKNYPTKLGTLSKAKNLLNNLTEDEKNWKLLYFYASLFELVTNTGHLELYGSGDFSILVKIIGGTKISLCTLPKNNTIVFALLR